MPVLSPAILLLLLTGPIAGSFIGVLIDRLPRGEDVLRRPSACRACARRLGPRDLVPLLSFVLNRGRCRHCGAEIPAWHLYVEIAATGLAILAVLAGGTTAWVWLTALVLWTLLALAGSDLVWFRLPDPLTLGLLALALARSWTGSGPGPDLAHAALGAGLGAGAFWLLRRLYAGLRKREGLGLGDVKLMAGIGALSGPALLPATVLAGSVLALAAVLAAAALGRTSMAPATRLPFGAALCGGAFGLWLWQAAGL